MPKKIKVFRLEAKAGYGPFRPFYSKDKAKQALYKKVRDDMNGSKFPAWANDPGIYNGLIDLPSTHYDRFLNDITNPKWRSGCKTKAQLKKWIRKFENLIAAGFQVVEYHLDEKDVIIGHYQVVFRRRKAGLVAKHTLQDFFGLVK